MKFGFGARQYVSHPLRRVKKGLWKDRQVYISLTTVLRHPLAYMTLLRDKQYDDREKAVLAKEYTAGLLNVPQDALTDTMYLP